MSEREIWREQDGVRCTSIMEFRATILVKQRQPHTHYGLTYVYTTTYSLSHRSAARLTAAAATMRESIPLHSGGGCMRARRSRFSSPCFVASVRGGVGKHESFIHVSFMPMRRMKRVFLDDLPREKEDKRYEEEGG